MNYEHTEQTVSTIYTTNGFKTIKYSFVKVKHMSANTIVHNGIERSLDYSQEDHV